MTGHKRRESRLLSIIMVRSLLVLPFLSFCAFLMVVVSVASMHMKYLTGVSGECAFGSLSPRILTGEADKEVY